MNKQTLMIFGAVAVVLVIAIFAYSKSVKNRQAVPYPNAPQQPYSDKTTVYADTVAGAINSVSGFLQTIKKSSAAKNEEPVIDETDPRFQLNNSYTG